MRIRPSSALLVTLSSVVLTAAAAGGAVAAIPPEAPSAAASVAAPAATDTDGDSLPDAWETNGYDANGDGVIDVNLPAMGATPNKKDLFVEMDYMSGRLATTAAFDRIKAVFAAAPVSNPDGSTGIRIHLDGGAAAGSAYNLGGGNQVPYDSNLQPAESQTDAIKNANFAPARKAVFHYLLWADDYDNSCSSGNAFAIPNDTFIVTMGPKQLDRHREPERGHLRPRTRSRPRPDPRRHRQRQLQAELPQRDELLLPVRRRPPHQRRQLVQLLELRPARAEREQPS
jgi:hypothetical protein